MREIGGFLELENNHGHEFHENGIALNSGRNCLRFLLRARKIRRIWLPKLLCSAISDTCEEENVEIEYYPVNGQLKPILTSVPGNEWIYLINYYGQYSDTEISSYCKQYRNVIVDNAQAFYSQPIADVDTIYTCRKFFGVPDGGYLYTTCKYKKELAQDESFERLQFLAGRFERSAQEFYGAYRNNEEVIDKLPLKAMSKITHNLLRGVDYAVDASIRERNFSYLHQKLKAINQLKVTLPAGPYMYPFYIKNGANLRQKLQRENIYIPVLWPNVKGNIYNSDVEYQLADNILPLPCDQRYTTEDMDYMIEKILRLETF